MQHLEYWNIEHTAGTFYDIDKVLLEKESPFQKIGFYHSPTEGVIFTLDGFIQLTEKTEYLYHEMLVHPAVNTHPDPQVVLIIGGGDCGILKQLLKYPSIQKVVMVEIDGEVIAACKEFLPQLTESLNDPRAELIIDDGFKYLADSVNHFDLIIIDSTDPDTIAKDLFSGDFYASCHKALKADGIMVAQAETSMIDYFDQLRKEIYHNLKAHFPLVNFIYFPEPCYPSGYFTCIMASKKHQINSADSNNIKAKTAAMNLQYYNADIHFACSAMSQRERKLLNI